MAYEQGDFNISTNVTLRKKGTWDARQYVANYSDLLEFVEADQLPNGFPVTVKGDDDLSKRGIWMLLNEDDLSNPLSWYLLTQNIPNNQVLQIGSYSYDSLTYVATLGATLDWVFIEEGVTFTVGTETVNLTAPDATFPRADIIVWDSVNGYQVVEGIPAEDYTIPNTPIGTILVQTIIRLVDGSTEPIPPPDLSGFAKLSGGNNFSGDQNIQGVVSAKNSPFRTNRRFEFFRRNADPFLPFPTSIPNYGFGINDDSNNLSFVRYAGGGASATDIFTHDYASNIIDFKERPTLNGVNLVDENQLDTKQDTLNETNFGNFMDTGLATKLTPMSGDFLLGRDSLTNEAVEIPFSTVQPSLGFTPENVANKENSVINTDATKYPTVNLLNIGLGTRQPLDSTLTALAAYNTNGILTQTAADTFTGRTITGTTNQVTVTNGNGVSGNPTLSLPQNIHTAATPQFGSIGLGAAANAAAYITAAANTASVGQVLFTPSATDYTGTVSGMLWNNASEWKFYDSVVGSVNRFMKLNGNSALANSNSLNVVTSTGTGGNLGTLKAEQAFGRYPTAVSYTVLLTDVGMGWVIAVTDTSAARTITLPAANSVTAGFMLRIKDEGGLAGTNNITIARAGTDTIDGATSLTINTNYGVRGVYSNGSNAWFTI